MIFFASFLAAWMPSPWVRLHSPSPCRMKEMLRCQIWKITVHLISDANQWRRTSRTASTKDRRTSVSLDKKWLTCNAIGLVPVFASLLGEQVHEKVSRQLLLSSKLCESSCVTIVARIWTTVEEIVERVEYMTIGYSLRGLSKNSSNA